MDYSIVTKLDLQNQGLTELPSDIHKYNNLIQINCSYNKLTTLDNLPLGLQTLYCNNNKLTYLDNLPPGLKLLFCNNNQLTSLDNLPLGLQELVCDNNPFTYNFKPTLENIRYYNNTNVSRTQ